MYNIEILKNAKTNSKYKVTFLDFNKKIDNKDIKNFRNNFNLTQISMANIFGVTKKTVEKWEQGKNKMSGSSALLFQLYSTYPEIIDKVFKVKLVLPDPTVEEINFNNKYAENLNENCCYKLEPNKIVNKKEYVVC